MPQSQAHGYRGPPRPATHGFPCKACGVARPAGFMCAGVCDWRLGSIWGGHRTDFHHFCFSTDPARNCSARISEFIPPLAPQPMPPPAVPPPPPAEPLGTLRHWNNDPKGFIIHQYGLYGISRADVEAVIDAMDGNLETASDHLYLTRVLNGAGVHAEEAPLPPPPQDAMDVDEEPQELEQRERPVEKPPPEKPQPRFITHEEAKRAAATCYRLWKHLLPRPSNNGGFSGDIEKMRLLSPNPPIITLPAPEILARMAMAEAKLNPDSPWPAVHAARLEVLDIFTMAGAGLSFLPFLPEVVFRDEMLAHPPSQLRCAMEDRGVNAFQWDAADPLPKKQAYSKQSSMR